MEEKVLQVLRKYLVGKEYKINGCTYLVKCLFPHKNAMGKFNGYYFVNIDTNDWQLGDGHKILSQRAEIKRSIKSILKVFNMDKVDITFYPFDGNK